MESNSYAYLDSLLALPREILFHIVTFLDFVDLLNVSFVNSTLRSIGNEDACWKLAYQRFFADCIKEADALPTFHPINHISEHPAHPHSWQAFFRIRYTVERFLL